MRPFNEIMRLCGLEEGASVPEPVRADPIALTALGDALVQVGRTEQEAVTGMEMFAREENIKPAVLMAAVREFEVSRHGQRLDAVGRRLIMSGRMEDGAIGFRWHPSMGF